MDYINSSTARANPHMKIYIVFITLHRSVRLVMNNQLKVLLSYPNINIVMTKLRSFSALTPASEFIVRGGLKNSVYPIVHTSDIFRFLLLWRYGGTYMDSDMIVRKSIDKLGSNFACVDGERGIVANAFLNFDTEDGHKIVEKLIKEQIINFNVTHYGRNGPIFLTNEVIKMCGTNETKKMIQMKECKGFHIYPRKYCYPIFPTYFKSIFDQNYTNLLMRKIKNAYTVHMWNGLNYNIETTKTSKNFYIKLAQQYCPKIYDAIDYNF